MKARYHVNKLKVSDVADAEWMLTHSMQSVSAASFSNSSNYCAFGSENSIDIWSTSSILCHVKSIQFPEINVNGTRIELTCKHLFWSLMDDNIGCVFEQRGPKSTSKSYIAAYNVSTGAILYRFVCDFLCKDVAFRPNDVSPSCVDQVLICPLNKSKVVFFFNSEIHQSEAWLEPSHPLLALQDLGCNSSEDISNKKRKLNPQDVNQAMMLVSGTNLYCTYCMSGCDADILSPGISITSTNVFGICGSSPTIGHHMYGDSSAVLRKSDSTDSSCEVRSIVHTAIITPIYYACAADNLQNDYKLGCSRLAVLPSHHDRYIHILDCKKHLGIIQVVDIYGSLLLGLDSNISTFKKGVQGAGLDYGTDLLEERRENIHSVEDANESMCMDEEHSAVSVNATNQSAVQSPLSPLNTKLNDTKCVHDIASDTASKHRGRYRGKSKRQQCINAISHISFQRPTCKGIIKDNKRDAFGRNDVTMLLQITTSNVSSTMVTLKCGASGNQNESSVVVIPGSASVISPSDQVAMKELSNESIQSPNKSIQSVSTSEPFAVQNVFSCVTEYGLYTIDLSMSPVPPVCSNPSDVVGFPLKIQNIGYQRSFYDTFRRHVYKSSESSLTYSSISNILPMVQICSPMYKDNQSICSEEYRDTIQHKNTLLFAISNQQPKLDKNKLTSTCDIAMVDKTNASEFPFGATTRNRLYMCHPGVYKSDFSGSSYPVGFTLIDQVTTYLEKEDELDEKLVLPKGSTGTGEGRKSRFKDIAPIPPTEVSHGIEGVETQKRSPDKQFIDLGGDCSAGYSMVPLQWNFTILVKDSEIDSSIIPAPADASSVASVLDTQLSSVPSKDEASPNETLEIPPPLSFFYPVSTAFMHRYSKEHGDKGEDNDINDEAMDLEGNADEEERNKMQGLLNDAKEKMEREIVGNRIKAQARDAKVRYTKAVRAITELFPDEVWNGLIGRDEHYWERYRRCLCDGSEMLVERGGIVEAKEVEAPCGDILVSLVESETEAGVDTIRAAENGTEAGVDTIKAAESGTEAGVDTIKEVGSGTEAGVDTIRAAENGTEAGVDTIISNDNVILSMCVEIATEAMLEAGVNDDDEPMQMK